MYVAARWHAVPERFPVHWDLAGRANGWGTRSIAGVFAPAMISTVVCLTMLGLSRTLTRRARVPPDHPAVRISAFVLLASSYLAAIVCGGLTIALPLSPVESPKRMIAVIVVASLLTVTAILVAARREVRRARLDGWSDVGMRDEGWKWGLIYNNPADPALWVPKRVGIGWTLNFGHPWGWPVMILLIAGPLLLAAVAIAVA